MGISSLIRTCLLWLWPAASEVDQRLLDGLIHDALYDEALSLPPAGTWEKLYKAIVDRQLVKSHGMWVLDEPFRDPPDVLSVAHTHNGPPYLSYSHLDIRFARNFSSVREAMWSNMPPSFMALVNW